MIRLIELNEDNWTGYAALSVDESQKRFLADNTGILARGYVYRDCRARILGIEADGTPAGLVMVRDLDEDPACYDLQQFMVDARFQGRGYGSEALALILAELEKERRYGCVEVCVNRAAAAALRVYEKAGFEDTGYTDPDLPDSLVLAYRFRDAEDGIRTAEVEDPDEKRRIAREVLESLTDWFGVEESREAYIAGSADLPFFAAYAGEETAGFLCLKETGEATAEIHVMGVKAACHRRGAGRRLFELAKVYAKRAGYLFLQVKTVRMGCYEEYDGTNRFYRSLGFREFEVFPELWDEANPCQIYVMAL